jgi:hypothetical protein
VWNARQAAGAVAQEDLIIDIQDINVMAVRLREHPVARGIGASQTLDITATFADDIVTIRLLIVPGSGTDTFQGMRGEGDLRSGIPHP